MELSGGRDGGVRRSSERRLAEKEVMIVNGKTYARSSLPGRYAAPSALLGRMTTVPRSDVESRILRPGQEVWECGQR
jgi:hypothetical protein